MISVLALAACPGEDLLPLDTEGASTGDIDPTTGGGPTTTPPTTTTVDPDTTAGEESSSGEGPVCEPECPLGQCCVAGNCFNAPPVSCEGGCADNEECVPVEGADPCEALGECIPVPDTCGTDGSYDPCIGVACPAGSTCIVDNPAAPSVSWCAVSGCVDECDCPTPPEGSEASCSDLTGSGTLFCAVSCAGGAPCPEGMSCIAGNLNICVWPAEVVDAEQYGSCLNGETCDPGVACISDAEDTFSWCGILDCADDTVCQPPPATGDAPAICGPINPMNDACLLDCSMDQTCPDGMECFGGFACAWPGMVTPEPGYGDCVNPGDSCLPTEDACLTDGAMMPMAGACSQSGCADATACPPAPATGDAVVSCSDFGGGNTCYLDCSMGETCPDGMACGEVGMGMGMGMACLWPLTPPDYTCVDSDLVSAVGAAVAMGTTVGGVDDFTPSCAAGNSEDVELQWTAPADGSYTFDTVGSDYNTILSVLTHCAGAELACNDDTMMLQSEVTVDLVAGQTVVIVIDGFDETGNYVLNIN